MQRPQLGLERSYPSFQPKHQRHQADFGCRGRSVLKSTHRVRTTDFGIEEGIEPACMLICVDQRQRLQTGVVHAGTPEFVTA